MKIFDHEKGGKPFPHTAVDSLSEEGTWQHRKVSYTRLDYLSSSVLCTRDLQQLFRVLSCELFYELKALLVKPSAYSSFGLELPAVQQSLAERCHPGLGLVKAVRQTQKLLYIEFPC